MYAGVLVALALLALLVLPLVLSLIAMSRSRRLEAELAALRAAVDSLRERLYEQKKDIKAPAPAAESEPVRAAPPPVAAQPPAAAPPPVAASPPVATPPPAVAPPPVAFEPPVGPVEPAAPPVAQAPSPRPEPPVPFGGVVAPARTMKPRRGPVDWEGFVGVRLFSWIAAVFLVIGAVFFLRYSIERGWLSAPVRMALGLVVGTGLLVVCEWKAARRYAVTANALDGAGIAILFATFFASHALWHLVGTVTAFVLMALVTAVAVALSIRRDSVFIALLGLLGGFATPALLSTGEDRPFGLFGYLLLLNAGLSWVAYRKRWAFLSVLCLAFTTLYQWGWVAKFLTGEKLGLAAGIFVVFPLLSILALFLLPATREETSGTPFGRTAAASAALPLLFALFVASVPAYGARWPLLFGFLFLVATALAALAAARGPEELHVLGGVGTLAVFATWLARTSLRPPPGPVIGVTAAFFLLYLLAGRIARRAGRPYGPTGLSAVYVAPILLFVFPVLAGIEPATSAPSLLFGPLLALAAAAAVVAGLEERPSLHLAAAPFVVGAQAVWLVERLVPANLLPGLSLFAVFGLFYMAVPAAARRWKLDGGTSGPVGALALSGQVLLVGVALRPELGTSPAPLLGVLALLTVAGSLLAVYLRETALGTAVLGLSQIVLLVFELGSKEAPGPSVAVVAALAVAFWGVGLFALSREKEPGFPALVGLFLAQAVAIAATIGPGAPSFRLVLAAHLLAVTAMLAIAWRTGWHVVAVLAAASSALAAFAFQAGAPARPHFREDLVFAGTLFALLLLYPLLLGKRAGKEREPYLAAVLASVAFFFLARKSFLDAGWDSFLGLLPVIEAALLAVLLVRLLRLGIPPAEDAPRLALVAGTILAFVAVAIPLQLDNEWITIGWALLAASLVWLHGRIPHGGLVASAAGLYAAVFIRLAFNPAVLAYHPRAATPIWNWYLYTYLVPAAAFFAGAWLLSREGGKPSPTVAPLVTGLRRLLPAGGTVLLFLLLNIEIADYFSTGPVADVQVPLRGARRGTELYARMGGLRPRAARRRSRPRFPLCADRRGRSPPGHGLQVLPLRPLAPRRALPRRLLRRPRRLARGRGAAPAAVRPRGPEESDMRRCRAARALVLGLALAAPGFAAEAPSRFERPLTPGGPGANRAPVDVPLLVGCGAGAIRRDAGRRTRRSGLAGGARGPAALRPVGPGSAVPPSAASRAGRALGGGVSPSCHRGDEGLERVRGGAEEPAHDGPREDRRPPRPVPEAVPT